MRIATTRKPNWTAIREHADAILKENDRLFFSFTKAVGKLFTSMWDNTEKPVKRRPNISLRLIDESEPRAKLSILPFWRSTPTSQSFDVERLRYELLTESVVMPIPDGPVKKYAKRINLTTRTNGFLVQTGTIRASAAEDVARVVKLVRDFTEDAKAVIARSSKNCVICGRGLVDEVSRARGIGPECYKVCDLVPWLGHGSAIVADEADYQLAILERAELLVD
jgi:hypothetical protein